MEKSTILSVSQAAKQTGKSDKTIRRWIKNEKLKAEKKGRNYEIRAEDLERVTKLVSKEWRTGLEIADILVRLEAMLLTLNNHSRAIEDLQKQMKKLLPKKTTKRTKTG